MPRLRNIFYRSSLLAWMEAFRLHMWNIQLKSSLHRWKMSAGTVAMLRDHFPRVLFSNIFGAGGWGWRLLCHRQTDKWVLIILLWRFSICRTLFDFAYPPSHPQSRFTRANVTPVNGKIRSTKGDHAGPTSTYTHAWPPCSGQLWWPRHGSVSWPWSALVRMEGFVLPSVKPCNRVMILSLLLKFPPTFQWGASPRLRRQKPS